MSVPDFRAYANAIRDKAELDELAEVGVTARVGATRACPDCGRPQHYTGTELGWCHDALVDTWHCADPRKPQRCLNCGAREDESCQSWCAYKPAGRTMA